MERQSAAERAAESAALAGMAAALTGGSDDELDSVRSVSSGSDEAPSTETSEAPSTESSVGQPPLDRPSAPLGWPPGLRVVHLTQDELAAARRRAGPREPGRGGAAGQWGHRVAASGPRRGTSVRGAHAGWSACAGRDD